MDICRLREGLELIYEKYNKRNFVTPDPLQFLYKFYNFEDIELAGLISSSFAYGKVENIINFLEKLFRIIKSPSEFLSLSDKKIIKNLSGLKYRFTKDFEIINFFLCLKKVLKEKTSLYKLFFEEYNKSKNMINAIKMFIKYFYENSKSKINSLLPDYRKNSAFKRFFLFLRWMVRKDEVDLGIWDGISSADLIYPVDTHIYKFAKEFNFTKRQVVNLTTAIEITEGFKKINPEDPVKYDFVITRFGINPLLKFLKKEVYHGLSTMGNTWN